MLSALAARSYSRLDAIGYSRDAWRASTSRCPAAADAYRYPVQDHAFVAHRSFVITGGLSILP